jgi:hypothetical protein
MELSLNAGKKELRQFGLLMGFVIAGVFGILIPLIKGKSILVPALGIGAVFFLAAGVAPKILSPVYKVWMVIGHVLGWINSRIILGALFFLMFVPVSLVLRLLGRDAMARQYDKKLMTYRVKRTYDKDIGSGMDRPF